MKTYIIILIALALCSALSSAGQKNQNVQRKGGQPIRFQVDSSHTDDIRQFIELMHSVIDKHMITSDNLSTLLQQIQKIDKYAKDYGSRTTFKNEQIRFNRDKMRSQFVLSAHQLNIALAYFDTSIDTISSQYIDYAYNANLDHCMHDTIGPIEYLSAQPQPVDDFRDTLPYWMAHRGIATDIKKQMMHADNTSNAGQYAYYLSLYRLICEQSAEIRRDMLYSQNRQAAIAKRKSDMLVFDMLATHLISLEESFEYLQNDKWDKWLAPVGK